MSNYNADISPGNCPEKCPETIRRAYASHPGDHYYARAWYGRRPSSSPHFDVQSQDCDLCGCTRERFIIKRGGSTRKSKRSKRNNRKTRNNRR